MPPARPCTHVRSRRPTEEIIVTGASEGRSRGSFVLKSSDEGVDFHVEGTFDTGYTDPRRSRFMTKLIYEDNEIYHRERLAMSLDKDGISVVSGAYDGVVVLEGDELRGQTHRGGLRIRREIQCESGRNRGAF